jgi:hypothetical protein
VATHLAQLHTALQSTVPEASRQARLLASARRALASATDACARIAEGIRADDGAHAEVQAQVAECLDPETDRLLDAKADTKRATKACRILSCQDAIF